MSKKQSHHGPQNEHGTVQSYVIGFVLSLICTFIPYYLVVEKIVTGNTLLATIVVFGFVQMLIQIVFFLHLGRGPKPNWNLFFFGSTFTIVLAVVGGSIFIIHNLNYNMSPSDKVKKLLNDENIQQIGGADTGVCGQTYESHIVTIKDGIVEPLQTEAKRCDTLTFVNEDEVEREITFGEHEDHEAYAGEIELPVTRGRNKTITLSEEGLYRFHDHLDPDISGYFTVQSK